MPDAVGINDPKPQLPFEKVCIVRLCDGVNHRSWPSEMKCAYLNVHPLLLLEGLQLLHESLLRHGDFSSKGVTAFCGSPVALGTISRDGRSRDFEVGWVSSQG